MGDQLLWVGYDPANHLTCKEYGPIDRLVMVSTLEPGSKRGAVFTTALLPDTLAAIQLAGKIPLIKPFSKYENIRIASQEDIAAMKIEAVMGI